MFGLVASLWGGYIVLDTRYAKAAEVKQQLGDVKYLYLRSEQRATQRQKFELDTAKEKRPLTELEKQRVKELEEDLKQLDEDIKAVKSK